MDSKMHYMFCKKHAIYSINRSIRRILVQRVQCDVHTVRCNDSCVRSDRISACEMYMYVPAEQPLLVARLLTVTSPQIGIIDP